LIEGLLTVPHATLSSCRITNLQPNQIRLTLWQQGQTHRLLLRGVTRQTPDDEDAVPFLLGLLEYHLEVERADPFGVLKEAV
jgi:hypothetical protein